jgi:hypothetical protein
MQFISVSDKVAVNRQKCPRTLTKFCWAVYPVYSSDACRCGMSGALGEPRLGGVLIEWSPSRELFAWTPHSPYILSTTSSEVLNRP